MGKFFKIYRGLSKEVYRLAIVRFILSMGNFIYPFMTLFLVEKLQIKPYIASLFFIISVLMFVPASIISGKISDNIGRRIVLLSSFLVYIIIIFTIFFLYHFNILRNTVIAVLLIIANLFLSMTQVPISTIITDVTEPINRNESFSFVYLAANAGFAFGPLIAGFLFENYTSMIFLGNALASVIGFIILFGLRETKPICLENSEIDSSQTISKSSETYVKIDNSAIKFILKDKIFFIFILSTIIFSFAYSQAGFTLPIFLSKIFKENGARIYGILQSTNAITVILLTPVVSYLTNKKSPILMVATAGIFYAFGFGFYSIFKIFPLLILTTIVWSTGEILQVTHQNVFIANRSPINIRGQLNGVFQILSGIGFLLGPLFSGFFQENFDINYIWIIVFFICLVGNILLVSNFKKIDKK
ncbi:MAG: MFS transporter [Exilispira sp.]|jgi:MFS family permease|nr:MFS transporter [Exilispira sp.]